MPVSDDELTAAWQEEQQRPILPPDMSLLGAGKGAGQLPKGGEPVIGTGSHALKKGQSGPTYPTSWRGQIETLPGWGGTIARMGVPKGPTDVILDVLGAGMFGPAGELVGPAAKGARGVLQGLRTMSPLKKLATGAATGAASEYAQGRSPTLGGVQGGVQMLGGRAGEKLGSYLAQRTAARTTKLTDPPAVAGPMTQSAPWLMNIIKKPVEAWNHLDFSRLFQRPSSEKAIGTQFRTGMKDIVAQADQIRGGRSFNRFASQGMEALDPANKGQTFTVQEVLDKIQDLRSGGYVRGIEQRGGMGAARIRDIRRQLVDETEDYLNRISGGTLGAEYADLRNNMGRSMSFMRLFNAQDVVKNSKIDMGIVQNRWLNQKQLKLDIENWLDRPEEFEHMENVIYRGGDPTTPDVAGQPGGMHVYATAALKPHGYFKLGKQAKFAGTTANQFSGGMGAYVPGRVAGGMRGEWSQQPQQVLTPDQQEKQGGVSVGGAIPPDQLAKARQQFPHLTEKQLAEAYAEYQAEQGR